MASTLSCSPASRRVGGCGLRRVETQSPLAQTCLLPREHSRRLGTNWGLLVSPSFFRKEAARCQANPVPGRSQAAGPRRAPESRPAPPGLWAAPHRYTVLAEAPVQSWPQSWWGGGPGAVPLSKGPAVWGRSRSSWALGLPIPPGMCSPPTRRPQRLSPRGAQSQQSREAGPACHECLPG